MKHLFLFSVSRTVLQGDRDSANENPTCEVHLSRWPSKRRGFLKSLKVHTDQIALLRFSSETKSKVLL